MARGETDHARRAEGAGLRRSHSGERGGKRIVAAREDEERVRHRIALGHRRERVAERRRRAGLADRDRRDECEPAVSHEHERRRGIRRRVHGEQVRLIGEDGAERPVAQRSAGDRVDARRVERAAQPACALLGDVRRDARGEHIDIHRPRVHALGLGDRVAVQEYAQDALVLDPARRRRPRLRHARVDERARADEGRRCVSMHRAYAGLLPRRVDREEDDARPPRPGRAAQRRRTLAQERVAELGERAQHRVGRRLAAPRHDRHALRVDDRREALRVPRVAAGNRRCADVHKDHRLRLPVLREESREKVHYRLL